MEIDFYPLLAAPDRPHFGTKEIRDLGLEKNLAGLTGALRIKHLMRLTARPFVWRVHEDGKLVSVIEAGMAFFEPGQGKLILRKEVKVSAYEAGEKVLSCNELHVKDGGRLDVKGAYAVTAANGIERGENLQSDLLLSDLSAEQF